MCVEMNFHSVNRTRNGCELWPLCAQLYDVQWQCRRGARCWHSVCVCFDLLWREQRKKGQAATTNDGSCWHRKYTKWCHTQWKQQQQKKREKKPMHDNINSIYERCDVWHNMTTTTCFFFSNLELYMLFCWYLVNFLLPWKLECVSCGERMRASAHALSGNPIIIVKLSNKCMIWFESAKKKNEELKPSPLTASNW